MPPYHETCLISTSVQRQPAIKVVLIATTERIDNRKMLASVSNYDNLDMLEPQNKRNVKPSSIYDETMDPSVLSYTRGTMAVKSFDRNKMSLPGIILHYSPHHIHLTCLMFHRYVAT